MIGEIRDRETAEIAVQASLTGHLVLSTVHTNDADRCDHADARHEGRAVPARLDAARGHRAAAGPAAVPGVPRVRVAARDTVAPLLGIDPGRHRSMWREGCDACTHSGFKGRIGVFEAVRDRRHDPASDQRGRRRGGDHRACLRERSPTLAEAASARAGAVRARRRPRRRYGFHVRTRPRAGGDRWVEP